MKTYLFDTMATMKEYNRERYWIDTDIIPEYAIKAKDLKSAISEYVSRVNRKTGVTISKNAVRHMQPIYRDTEDNISEQVGYCMTGKTYFYDEAYRSHEQYIDLWIDMAILESIDFREEGMPEW